MLSSAAAWGGPDEAGEHVRIFERCITSTARAAELHRTDMRHMARSREAAYIAVPLQFRSALTRLSKVAHLPQGVVVALIGVNSTKSAFVLSSGAIYVSNALWNGDVKLDDAEAAAVVAHELAHLEFSHVKDRLCHAVASAGDERLLLSAATGATHQAIWGGGPHLALPMMQRNHLRELQADTRAKQMLREIGMDPGAVARMLVKVAGNGGGGFSEFHPATETRLENLARKDAAIEGGAR
ncbi:MAG: hypothetical protein EOP20_09145 [Hyphomicrobiales bacterium]|nr:MAG: hypothetical protein EOP20_09145 [Hyphomicrobiales bacterium]